MTRSYFNGVKTPQPPLSGGLFQRSLQKAEIKSWLQATGKAQTELFAQARAARKKYFGNNVYLRGLIEFSNVCAKNCYYCGIRRGNHKIKRYCLTLAEIKPCLNWIQQADFGSVVLQSGEVNTKARQNYLLKLIKFIQTNYADLTITLSAGELDFDFLRQLRKAGVERYLLRIETSNPDFYAQIHPADHSFPKRIKCLQNLRALDYQTGSGNLIGLPGQTLENLCADLDFFQKMDFDMFGLGPYVAHKDTPLATPEVQAWWRKNKTEIFNLTLNFLAILRILRPTCNIAAATALDVFNPLGRIKALQIAANVIMPAVTPVAYRKQYLLYQGKPGVDADMGKNNTALLQKIKKAGLVSALGEKGTSLHYLQCHCEP